MTTYRMIGGLVAVAMLAAAAAATAATMLSHAPSTGQRQASACIAPLHVVADLSKLPIEEFEDLSLVFSGSR